MNLAIDFKQIMKKKLFIPPAIQEKDSLDGQTDKSIFRELSGLHSQASELKLHTNTGGMQKETRQPPSSVLRKGQRDTVSQKGTDRKWRHLV